ncbi:trimethylamine methyltransferase family protein [Ruegeria sp. 2012CJ41-6]|uniref:Trimethylamine methyltransferase family protein n=1 Tax=Ruegeria spongiae TaxID=2942209 RepID=A0ABT0Q8H7_9RHOB|nr:trimethylamine methyltransferase family protein [Ruegeria spongiae]MCL6286102.1 trimethylamine methyltransferase family protein [Ruegeria spongiae]
MDQSAKTKKPARLRRKSSRGEKISRKSHIAGIGTLRDQKHRISIMTGAEAGLIHDAVLNILWSFGVLVEHPASRKTLIEEHGCIEADNEYIRFPPDLVQNALSTVPSSVQLYDLNGNLKVDTNSKLTAYCPGHNCVRILDHETGKLRPCTLEDIRRTATVCEKLPNIAMSCSLGYPSDVNAEDEAFETAKTLFEHCAKPAAILAHDDAIQTRIVDHLVTLVGSAEKLAEKPVAIELMGPISPLKLPEDFCQRLINAARMRLPVVCYPATFPGMSSPISAAGAIAQSSAEAIAGLVLHQLSQPGAPVVCGSSVLPMDMRQADLAYGSPEYMLTGLGAADYFKHIGVPSWIGAGCSDSHDFDAQAASEAGANMAIAAMASTPFVHNLGYLSGGRTGSLEMLVLCDELVGWSNQMAAGCVIDADSIAVDVIRRASHDNSFLTDQHTQDRYLTENWFPSLLERSDADAWMERGSPDLRHRIRENLAQLLR